MPPTALDPWPAPPADTPVDARVRLPGSKSVTNRALILAALADRPGAVRLPLRARDTLLMAGALRALGVEVAGAEVAGVQVAGAGDAADDSAVDWTVSPARLRGPATVDCGLAGTVMRFVPPVAALADGTVTFDGDPWARRRPMAPILTALRTLGTTIDDGARGSLPFTVDGHGSVSGGAVTLDASGSSQFISALLLAGPRYDDGVTVHHVGKPVPSLPHIAMSIAMLRERGVTVDDTEPNTWRVEPGPIAGLDTTIEPDLSNAAPFLAAALVTGGRVVVPGWPTRTTQGGDSLREILAQMGADCRLDNDGLTVGGGGSIAGIDVDLHEVGELTPVIAALAALADSPSYLRGVAHLRNHETDRLAALATELSRLGGDVTETEDSLTIRPRPLHAGTFATYDDHRMAQAAAVLGLAVPGLGVENIATTAKTLPDFVGLWASLLGREAAA